jgi:hypothetical protein
MSMLGKAEVVGTNKGMKPKMSGSGTGDEVTITLSRQDAENLLLALTTSLGGGNDKKKKKKDIPEPPFGK